MHYISNIYFREFADAVPAEFLADTLEEATDASGEAFLEYANQTTTRADTDTILFFHTFGSPRTGIIAIQIPNTIISVRFFMVFILAYT
jgi:hypothetical protein